MDQATSQYYTAPNSSLGRLLLKSVQRWLYAHTSAFHRDSLVPLDNSLREALLPWADPDFCFALFQ